MLGDLQTGDIAINAGSWPGHVMMVYEGGGLESAKTKIIHGQNSGNFHIDDQLGQKGHIVTHLVDTGTWVFRPPWDKLGGNAETRRDELKKVAGGIAKSAKYGLYRAVRLFLGSSEFGADARTRLQKYRERRTNFMLGSAPKFVSTITCAEAVILAYQITFKDDEAPFFIKKDAAHTMPRTLRDYLADPASGWTVVSKGY
jgi:hypothetical protein